MTLIVDGLVEITRAEGGEELICLSSLTLMRALRQIGYEVSRLGDTYRNDEDGRQYAVLRMPAEFSRARQLRVAPIPFPSHRLRAEPSFLQGATA